MIKDLIRLANRLDEKGLQKEADMVDKMILRLAEEEELTKEQLIKELFGNNANEVTGGFIEGEKDNLEDVAFLSDAGSKCNPPITGGSTPLSRQCTWYKDLNYITITVGKDKFIIKENINEKGKRELMINTLPPEPISDPIPSP